MGFNLSEKELDRKGNRKVGKDSTDETLGLIANWMMMMVMMISYRNFWGGP